MILDERTEFADAASLSTSGTGLALVGDVIDLGPVGRNIGNTERQVFLVITINVQPTSAGAATIGFVLASDAQAAIAVDGTASEHYRTALVPKADLAVGYTFRIPLPLENPAYERYIGILQNVGVAALTAGKIDAFLTFVPKTWKAHADAI